jgi:hypothetical protein
MSIVYPFVQEIKTLTLVIDQDTLFVNI